MVILDKRFLLDLDLKMKVLSVIFGKLSSSVVSIRQTYKVEFKTRDARCFWFYDWLVLTTKFSNKQEQVVVPRTIKSRSFMHVLIREFNLIPKPSFQGANM